MSATLCGLENELALSIRDTGHNNGARRLCQFLLATIQQTVPALPCKECGANMGLMLAQGSKIYIDGPFLEPATPEVRRPEEAIAYQRAGERIILEALPKAAKAARIQPELVTLTRAVTDYSGENYCGAHFNILSLNETTDLATALVPFVVTCIWGRSGGLGPTGVVLSQKSRAIRCTLSQDTRVDRPIINTKQEPLSSTGTKRVHLTSFDAPMSEWGTYLTLGCTMLLVSMLDAGVCVGPAVTLEDPVRALQQLDQDPFAKRPLRLASGDEMSALEIQYHYFRAAQAYVKTQPAGWMQELLVRWHQVLVELENEPARLANKLDPFIKMKLFSGIAAKHGFSMNEFSAWCGVLSLLDKHVNPSELPVRAIKEHVRENLPFVPFHLVEERMARFHLAWSRLPKAFALWTTLLATDLQYHDVSNNGLFWRLRRAGLIDSTLVDDAAITRAMSHPPGDTRAKARGGAIKNLAAAEGGFADWGFVASPNRKVDLSDPFSSASTWKILSEKKEQADVAKA